MGYTTLKHASLANYSVELSLVPRLVEEMVCRWPLGQEYGRFTLRVVKQPPLMVP